MSNAWTAAVHLLSRREHGEQELLGKLIQKGHDLAEVQAALEKCKDLHLQSDTRFAESTCRARIRQGYGPLRIRQELFNKQIASEVIEEILEQESENWFAYALEVWKKKDRNYGESRDFATLQKIQRFLLYRGFPASLITQITKMEQ